jgi:hypothetical protein
MTFEITHAPGRKAIPLGPGIKGVKFVACERYVWVLTLADGTKVCRSADEFDTAAAARIDISRFRQAAKALRYTKVVEV